MMFYHLLQHKVINSCFCCKRHLRCTAVFLFFFLHYMSFVSKRLNAVSQTFVFFAAELHKLWLWKVKRRTADPPSLVFFIKPWIRIPRLWPEFYSKIHVRLSPELFRELLPFLQRDSNQYDTAPKSALLSRLFPPIYFMFFFPPSLQPANKSNACLLHAA